MPANLTPDYISAEKRFKAAREINEKIMLLEEMISLLPKHKGTDKIFGELKRKLSKLKESKDTAKKSGRKEHWQVQKEGAGQVVLVGPPNGGKSSILKTLTHAHPDVTIYPFATRMPVPGMLPFEDIQIQLVELPALTADVMETWLPNAIMMADFMVIVLDLSSDDVLDDLQATFDQVEKRRIKIVPEQPEKMEPGYRYVPSIIVGNKMDIPSARDNLDLLKEMIGNKIPLITLSTEQPKTCQILGQTLFRAMKIIRVYPKRPGKKIERIDPLILRKGATVLDAATALHKDIAATLKSAKGWGDGIYDGQNLAKNFILKVGFTLEFH